MRINTSFRTMQNSFTEAALNPQPLPPKESATLFPSGSEKVALNPQPLPPKTASELFAKLLEKLGLIGPSPAAKSLAASSPSVLQNTALNPQPLPPKASGGLLQLSTLPNGGLMSNPTGNNYLSGGLIAYNPNFYATEPAAAAIAKEVGGSVIDLRGQVSNNQSEYFIALPNGITINAGNLLAILNNPVYRENSRVMDGKIAELLNNDAVGTPGAGTGKYTVVDGHVSYTPAT